MRNVKLIFLSLVSLCFASCDPPNNDLFITENVRVKATIDNPLENVVLGDTIKIRLRLPDTIYNNAGSPMILQTLQRGQFGMSVFKVDTATKTVSSNSSSFTWLTKGNREGNLSFILNNDTRPFECNINIKPPSKGLYYIEIISQPGKLKMNSNYEANLFVDFNVPDKHYNILGIVATYFEGQRYYDAVVLRESKGLGSYFFRVN